MDNGHVRYFGDHKPTTTVASGRTTRNAALLDAFTGHQGRTLEERATAVPLQEILFEYPRLPSHLRRCVAAPTTTVHGRVG
nr:hypothetical protein [Streptomyces sp. 3214.6]